MRRTSKLGLGFILYIAAALVLGAGVAEAQPVSIVVTATPARGDALFGPDLAAMARERASARALDPDALRLDYRIEGWRAGLVAAAALALPDGRVVARVEQPAEAATGSLLVALPAFTARPEGTPRWTVTLSERGQTVATATGTADVVPLAQGLATIEEEPNNDLAQAASFYSEVVEGSADVDRDPADCFRLYLNQPTRVRLTLRTVQFTDPSRTRWTRRHGAEEDLDLALLSQDGQAVAERVPSSANTPEEIIEANLSPGTYVVRVSAYRDLGRTFRVASDYFLTHTEAQLEDVPWVSGVLIRSTAGAYAVAGETPLTAHAFEWSQPGEVRETDRFVFEIRWFEDGQGNPIRTAQVTLGGPRFQKFAAADTRDALTVDFEPVVTDTLPANLVRAGHRYEVRVTVRRDGAAGLGTGATASTRAALTPAQHRAFLDRVRQVSARQGIPGDWRMEYARHFPGTVRTWMRRSGADCADFMIETWYQWNLQTGSRFFMTPAQVTANRRVLTRAEYDTEANRRVFGGYLSHGRDFHIQWYAGPTNVAHDGWGARDSASNRTYLFSRRVPDRNGDGRVDAFDALPGDYHTLLGHPPSRPGGPMEYGHTVIVVEVLASDHYVEGATGRLYLATLSSLQEGLADSNRGWSPLREPLYYGRDPTRAAGITEVINRDLTPRR